MPLKRLDGWLWALLSAAGGGAAWAFAAFPRDDALITYRYALRLSQGLGFSYQEGAAVCGSSTPLWTLLLALGARLGAPPALAAPALGALCHALAVPLLVRLGARLGRRRGGWIAASMYALCPPVVAIAGSGMESAAATLALLATLTCALEGRALLGGACMGIALLLRLDLALFALLLLLWWRVSHRRWPWPALAAAVAVQLPWWIYAQATFGSIVPHSVNAKLVFYSASEWPRPAATLDWFAGDPARIVLSLSALLGAWVASRSRRGAWLIAAWPLAQFLSYDLAGTLVHEWYRTPPYPVFFLFAALGGALLIDRVAGGRARAAASVARIGALLLLAAGAARLPATWSLWDRSTARMRGAHGEVAAWLRAHAAPDHRVACGDIGLIGLECGARILDTVGLVSPEVVPYNRRRDFLGIYTELRPEWAVIGTYGPLFSAIIEAPSFRALYREEARFAYTEEIDYVVYRLLPPSQSRKSASTGA